jgi:hypothetical protein
MKVGRGFCAQAQLTKIADKIYSHQMVNPDPELEQMLQALIEPNSAPMALSWKGRPASSRRGRERMLGTQAIAAVIYRQAPVQVRHGTAGAFLRIAWSRLAVQRLMLRTSLHAQVGRSSADS